METEVITIQSITTKKVRLSRIEYIKKELNMIENSMREFELDAEPLHLWEAYYRGDSNQETLEEKAKKLGYDGSKGLLLAMDCRLIELCEDVEEK